MSTRICPSGSSLIVCLEASAQCLRPARRPLRHATPAARPSRHFSSTPSAHAEAAEAAGEGAHTELTEAQEVARAEKRKLGEWLRLEGEQYRRHTPGETNYLAKTPFPANPLFRSHPVLSESSRELIWKKVMREGEGIKAVSAEMGVDMRRVAAVVRLKEMEKKWTAEGKPLATPYAKAVMDMLPQTYFRPREQNQPHEAINEMHVHSRTMQQIFQPVSESRHFTRADAARAFGDGILPADKRVPHPELVQLERDMFEAETTNQGADENAESAAFQKFKDAARNSELKIARRRAEAIREKEERTIKASRGRAEFRFEAINADDVGKDGRSRKGTGWRYGVPFYDRRKGEVKIPTKVE